MTIIILYTAFQQQKAHKMVYVAKEIVACPKRAHSLRKHAEESPATHR